MKAKKLFPDLSFKRLWNKLQGIEDKVNEQNKNLNKKYDYSKKEEITSLDTVGGRYTVKKQGKIILFFAGENSTLSSYTVEINGVPIGTRGIVSNNRHIWSTELIVQENDVLEVKMLQGFYDTQNCFIPYE